MKRQIKRVDIIFSNINKKLRREISNKLQLGESVTRLKDVVKVPLVDNSADLKEDFKKLTSWVIYEGMELRTLILYNICQD